MIKLSSLKEDLFLLSNRYQCGKQNLHIFNNNTFMLSGLQHVHHALVEKKFKLKSLLLKRSIWNFHTTAMRQ